MADTKMIANFGTVSGLRITTSRGTPVAYFTLKTGEKFSRDCVVYGAERVEKMKAIGDGRQAWVRGEIIEMTRKNENGGSYKTPVLKGFNLKDITDQPRTSAKSDDTPAAADETAAAEAETPATETVAEVSDAEAQKELLEEIPF